MHMAMQEQKHAGEPEELFRGSGSHPAFLITPLLCGDTRGATPVSMHTMALAEHPAGPELVPGHVGAKPSTHKREKPHGQSNRGAQKGVRVKCANAQKVGGAEVKQACNAAHEQAIRV